MKTVIDAVNEYEGIAPKPCYMENKEQIIMAKKPFEGYLTGDLTTGDGVRDNKYWKVICTREEFNQCVDEMATNYGRSNINFEEHCVNEAVRLIDDEAIEKNKIIDVSCDYCGQEWQCKSPDAQTMACPCCGDKPGVMTVTVPTFTQETSSSDNSAPVYSQKKSVLMEESLKCIIDHLSEYGVCGVNEMVHDNYHARSVDELHSPQQKAKWIALNALDLLNIKPLTPPIELEDGERYEFMYEGIRRLAFYNSRTKEFDMGMSHWLYMNCTNIQLLEVAK